MDLSSRNRRRLVGVIVIGVQAVFATACTPAPVETSKPATTNTVESGSSSVEGTSIESGSQSTTTTVSESLPVGETSPPGDLVDLGSCVPSSLLAAGYLSEPDPEKAPLSFAAYEHDLATIERLLSAGVNPNAEIVEVGLAHPLDYAAISGCEDTVTLLISAGASVTVDSRYFQPMVAATVGGNGNVVDLLVASGAEPDAPWGPEAWHPLHHAAYVGATGAADALILAGVDIDRTTLAGETPLRWASIAGHVEVVDLLLRSGASAGVDPLVAAAEAGHTEVVERLLQAGADPNQRSESYDGLTAIEIATMNGHFSVADMMEVYGD